MNRYHINVFWDEESDCWVADVPDLQTCCAFGDTPEEAVAEVKVAMEGWLETARAHGLEIPEPRYRPTDLPVARRGDTSIKQDGKR